MYNWIVAPKQKIKCWRSGDHFIVHLYQLEFDRSWKLFLSLHLHSIIDFRKKVVYSKAKLRHCYSHIIQGYFESPTRQRSQHIGHSEFGALQVPAPSLCSSSSSSPLMAGYMLHSGGKADSERNRIKASDVDAVR